MMLMIMMIKTGGDLLHLLAHIPASKADHDDDDNDYDYDSDDDNDYNDKSPRW